MLTQANNQIFLLGFSITRLPLKDIVSLALDSFNFKINCFNVHSYVCQKDNVAFKTALSNSDILIPDGSGIALSSIFLEKVSIKKVSGYDLFLETMQRLDESSGSVFLLGSSEVVLKRMFDRAKGQFPNVKVKYLSPPFKSDFNLNDVNIFVEAIEKERTDVVFVGLTAPKQEILIQDFPIVRDVKFLAGVGAVFDFYAGTITRPNKIWRKLHLEWLGRFLRQPRHLWRRIFVSMPIFLADLLRAKMTKILK